MALVTSGKNEQTMKTEQNVKITLYWLSQSRSQRILFLLEHLNLPYAIKTYQREKGFAPSSLKDVHPLGKIPILSIESPNTNPPNKPLVLAESGLIVEYLIEHFGPELAPARYAKGGEGGGVGQETESWLRYRYFMHYAEGSLMPYLVIWLLFNGIKTMSPFFIRPLARLMTGAVETMFLNPNLRLQWDFLEAQLASAPNNGEFMCGAQMTGADVMMSVPLGAAKRRSFFTAATHPKLCAYVDRLEAMDGWKRAVRKIVDTDGKYEEL